MKTQVQVLNKLEPEALKALDQIRHAGGTHVSELWARTKQSLKECVLRHYRTDFPNGAWSALAIGRGTISKIDAEAGSILRSFHQESMRHSARTFRELYKESVLRRAWILDQVTPPSVTVHLPARQPMLETERGMISTFTGPEGDAAWKIRWAAWMDAYHSALIKNLQMGAINERPLDDAMDEVDQTRPGTPSSDVGYALFRIFETESQVVATAGARDLVDANRGVGVKEIWQTRYNARVCDICAEQVGLTRAEASADIPAHPNCECYWRLVPASWADLLKSGEPMDGELAKDLDAAGLVPGGMYVYGPGGKIVASVTVTFPEWLSSRITAVTGS